MVYDPKVAPSERARETRETIATDPILFREVREASLGAKRANRAEPQMKPLARFPSGCSRPRRALALIFLRIVGRLRRLARSSFSPLPRLSLFEEKHVATVSTAERFRPEATSRRERIRFNFSHAPLRPCLGQAMVCMVVRSAAALASQTHYSYLNEFSLASPNFLPSPLCYRPAHPPVSLSPRQSRVA